MPAPTIITNRTVRLLLALAAGAIAVPVIPWMLWGARLDHAVADWLDPLPPPAVLAAAEIGVLAADIILPVPSSLVATLGGASLGVAVGTLCGSVGLTIGSLAGWLLGRIAGRRSFDALDARERAAVAARRPRLSGSTRRSVSPKLCRRLRRPTRTKPTPPCDWRSVPPPVWPGK